MRIENVGLINSYAEAAVPISNRAVNIIDPEAPGRGTAIYCIVAMLIPCAAFCIKYAMIGETPMVFSLVGILIGCVLALPHELIHGICFPGGSQVKLYQMMHPSRIFVTSDQPMSKARFVFMSLVPAFVLGLIPLMIWVFIPPYSFWARTIFSIGFMSIITSGRDYMHVIKVLGAAPPSAKIIMSGAKIYYISDPNVNR